jgi:demethylmenaquinone methyltransferase/2-methoxy-6-polyprenyl-1,4-benzoquinol methylase
MGEYIKRGVDKKRYDRAAALYDVFESPMEVMAFSKWRKLLFERLEGNRILEVGIGTGKNIQYYGGGNFIGIDISLKMLEKAKEKVEKLRKNVELIQCDAEALPFKNDVFDAAVSTYVFCSVENPIRGLRELYRVLKPGGRVYFLEHMRCENEIGGVILDVLNPIARVFGPEINRRTVENIRKAGFRVVKEEWLLTSVFRFIIAEK